MGGLKPERGGVGGGAPVSTLVSVHLMFLQSSLSFFRKNEDRFIWFSSGGPCCLGRKNKEPQPLSTPLAPRLSEDCRRDAPHAPEQTVWVGDASEGCQRLLL